MNNKMKMITALKIGVVIYPSLLLLQYALKDLLSAMPVYARTLLMTIILVPWVVFAGIPFLNFLIGKIKSNEKI